MISGSTSRTRRNTTWSSITAPTSPTHEGARSPPHTKDQTRFKMRDRNHFFLKKLKYSNFLNQYSTINSNCPPCPTRAKTCVPKVGSAMADVYPSSNTKRDIRAPPAPAPPTPIPPASPTHTNVPPRFKMRDRNHFFLKKMNAETNETRTRARTGLHQSENRDIARTSNSRRRESQSYIQFSAPEPP